MWKGRNFFNKMRREAQDKARVFPVMLSGCLELS
jgi:hypothetical protein